MHKKIVSRILCGEKIYCPKRPDCTNYRKHIEDALTGTILRDDNLVVAGETQKYYAREVPKTVIVVQEIEDTHQLPGNPG